MFDSHVHSIFSPDSEALMKETLNKSVEKGLKSLCFTDHYDLDYDGKNNNLIFDFEKYFQIIQSLRHEFQGIIDIRIGIELGLQPHLSESYHNLVRDVPFDYILASIHNVDREDLYSGTFFDQRTQQEAYHDYFCEMEQCITSFNSFQVLGHIDVIKRYGNFPEILPYENYREILREILSKLILQGKGIELNTSGIRYGLKAFHPSADILKDFKELGGEIITLGSDSHVSNGTGAYFTEAMELLKFLGFNYYTSFRNQNPIFHKI